MKNILEIMVDEELNWSVSADGNTDEIIVCTGDIIAGLIGNLSTHSNGRLTKEEVYNKIVNRITDNLINK